MLLSTAQEMGTKYEPHLKVGWKIFLSEQSFKKQNNGNLNSKIPIESI